MKNTLVLLLTLAASLSVSMAQTIVNTGFISPYVNGDLAGQQGWIAMPNTGTNAFQVTDAAGSGFADTVPTTLSTNGNFVYRDTLAAGNSISDEWDGVVDFNLSAPTAAGFQGGDVLRIGLSDTVTNGLLENISGQVPLRVNVNGTGVVAINSSDESGTPNLLTIDAATMGWDIANTDLVTDDWRLSWKIRKTTVTDYYSLTCSMTNLTTPANIIGSGIYLFKPDAFAAAGLYTVMGRSQFAEYGGTNSINITIDDLSIVKSASNPVRLYPSAIAVEAGDAFVNLSWPSVVEATSYDVKRSDTIDGTYSTLFNIIDTNYVDNTVVNGSVYYYKVTSINGAITADSDPVEAAPDVPVTGTIIDTTFAATDTPPYADGDLDGQNSWKSIVASGAPAFNVDSTGNGFAETATFSNDFNNVTGNQVYYNRIMENGVDAQWNGSVLFTLQTTPLAGLFVTNETVEAVASLSAGEVLNLGLSSDTTLILQPNGDQNVLITLRGAANGDIALHLNGVNGNAHKLLTVTREQLGWDPEWNDATAGPDFETDPITLNWTIRKTAIANAYMGAVDVTVGGSNYVGLIHFTDSTVANVVPVALYPALFARFGMSHAYQAQTVGNSMTDLSIDALSLTHTNVSEILQAAPYDLKGSASGDKVITVSWSGAIEASSFDVYRSDDSGNTWSFLANTPAATKTYVDSGLTDLYTYFYAVKAKYAGGDSVYSDPLAFRALGVIPVTGMEWGPRADIVGGTAAFAMSTVTSNGISTYVGNDGVDKAFSTASMFNAPRVYGVAQNTNAWLRADVRNDQGIPALDQFEFNVLGNLSALLYIKVPEGTLDLSTGIYSLEVENNSAQGGNWHAAIHDSVSGNWYVGDTEYTATGINNMGALNQQGWRLLNVASLTANNTAFMAYDINPIVTPNLSAVDEIGIFANQTPRIRMRHLVVRQGSAPSSYDLWTDSYGIYNADAASTNDYDEDGFSNAWEWGMDGDPNNANPGRAGGGLKEAEFLTVGGDVVYIYPRLKALPPARPDYFLTETANLPFTPFTDQEGGYTITSGGTWPSEPDFEAVMNVIPAAAAVKFIKLNIE